MRQLRSRKLWNFRSRYLVSYLVILLIPTILLGVVISQYILRSLQSEVTVNNVNTLRHVEYNIDSNIAKLNAIAYEIYMNPHLTKYAVSAGVLNEAEGVSQLQSYTVGNELSYQVFVYYRSMGMICSSSRVDTVPDFFKYSYHFSDWNAGSMESSLQQVHRNVFGMGGAVTSLTSDETRLITYVVPNDTLAGDRSVFFLIDQDSIEKIINPEIGSILIYDPIIGSVITSSQASGKSKLDVASIPHSELKRLIDDSVQGRYRQKISGVWYFVTQIRSSETGCVYLMLLPFQSAMGELIHVRLIFLCALFLVCIVALLAIALVMNATYKPVRQLRDYVAQQLSDPVEELNEIDTIRYSVDRILRNSHDLGSKIQRDRIACREYLLLTLLKGGFTDMEEFNRRGAEEGIRFSHPMRFVAAVDWQAAENTENPGPFKVVELIEKSLPEGLEGFGKLSTDSDNLIFIFAADPFDENRQMGWMQEIQRRLLESAGIRITVGVGCGYTALDMLGRSYIEASAAIRFLHIKGRNRVILFSRVGMCRFSTYPFSSLKALELCVMEGDADRVEQIVSKLLDLFDSDDFPIFELKCICFDVINTICKTLHTIDCKYAGPQMRHPDVMGLNSIETTDALIDAVRQISAEACSQIRQNREENTDHLVDRLSRYVKENGFSYEFSVQAMADHFHMTVSNVSHFYKQNTGTTIQESVNTLRLERARELLETSVLPLQDIIAQVGYADVSSFVRKFRNKTGMTPGNYRKAALRSLPDQANAR